MTDATDQGLRKLHRGYKYRLYPDFEQARLLGEWQETHRRFWNDLLGPYLDAIKANVVPKKKWNEHIVAAKVEGASDVEESGEAIVRELRSTCSWARICGLSGVKKRS
jgi:hypothetical protein